MLICGSHDPPLQRFQFLGECGDQIRKFFLDFYCDGLCDRRWIRNSHNSQQGWINRLCAHYAPALSSGTMMSARIARGNLPSGTGLLSSTSKKTSIPGSGVAVPDLMQLTCRKY